ncbi:MAG: integral rane sensor signal transduction histidine kinase [Anaerocolumna sp.]|nr:integral rane sensor signal transduction histidine kinase [Anaerocolumna sp.]
MLTRNGRTLKKKTTINSEKKNKIKLLHNLKLILILALIMLVFTSISMQFFRMHVFESNIVLLYLLGVILFSYLAEGYVFSILSTICAVLLYNFFFTKPYYTFKVDNTNYFITFIVMFIVGIITSMLTIRIKSERQEVEDREKNILAVYNIGKRLLDVKNDNDLAQISAEEISNQLNANVLVQFYDQSAEVLCKYIQGDEKFDGVMDLSAAHETYHSGSPCGYGTLLFSDAKAYYKPIFNKNGVFGIIGIARRDKYKVTEVQSTFIDVIIPQIVVVSDRLKISENQKKVQLEMQKERLQADMLRSISHDFRTPLAGIMGLASTAIDNYDKIDDNVRKKFLQSIYEDADWLNELVENILQTTRFEEGKVKLNMEEEAAEEIITDAVTHIKRHAKRHNIYVNIPDEIILIQVDGILIRQVIVNLLNNAINYSPNGSDINISLYRQDNKVVFEVKDNGPGILQEELTHIFDRYYRIGTNKKMSQKGMGLGLNLCKSIIEAHGGNITIRNYNPHGTIVDFYIPSVKE